MTDIKKPLFFKKNRVRRIYTGGKQFAKFFGDDSTEGYYPEEWVCSCVKALNDGSTVYNEGISVLESGEYFHDILKAYQKELLGEGREELGVLVKFLDSSIRLPLQVHPDKAFSKKYFHSEFGKTESWIIIGTEPDACIYFGFNAKYTTEQLRAAFEEEDDTHLLAMMNRIPVKVGDVFLIPGKAIHAIGKGCLLIEVQEPTDFTIQPERRCGEYILSEKEKYLGLTPEEAFECFDMDFIGMEAIEKRNLRSKPIKNGNTEKLITYEQTPCFAVNRHYVNEKVSLFCPSIYVVSNGQGTVSCGSYKRQVKKGDYFFAPYIINGSLFAEGENLEMIECCLPLKESLIS